MRSAIVRNNLKVIQQKSKRKQEYTCLGRFLPPRCYNLRFTQATVKTTITHNNFWHDCRVSFSPFASLITFLETAVYECVRTQTFWQMVIVRWDEKRSKNVAFNAADFLCGYKLESNLFIVAKYHISSFVVKQSLYEL